MADNNAAGHTTGDTTIKNVLTQIQDWPVDHAAAVVLDGDRQVTSGDVDRTFALASVSKLVTAYATLMAIEEGAFELDDAVPADLVPEFDTPPTVRELLAHASGIAFQKREPQRAARERRIYSSAGYEVLADLIEREADMGFAEYIDMGICQPLGIQIVVEGSAGHGFSASTAAMATLAGEFLRPQLLAPQTVAEALSVQYADLAGIVPGYGRFNPCPWGLGFEIHGEKKPHWVAPSMPGDVAGHFGQAGTFLWVHPETQRAAVVLTDKPFGSWAKPLWQEFNDELWAAFGD